MAGHNGYGATRGGYIPRGQRFDLPRVDIGAATLANQLRRLADEHGLSVRDAYGVAKRAGLADYDDETAEAIIALASA